MRYTMWISGVVGLLLFAGCGSSDSTTPLAHHDKELNNAFDPSVVVWQVDNNEGLRINEESEYIYLQFDHSASQSDAQNVQFIIDIDNNTSTGNMTENGADYIVENGYLYQSKSRTRWDWQELGKMDSAVEGNVDTVRIPLSMLENKRDVFAVNAELLDDRWQPVLYSPSAIDENGNHKKTRYPDP